MTKSEKGSLLLSSFFEGFLPTTCSTCAQQHQVTQSTAVK